MHADLLLPDLPVSLSREIFALLGGTLPPPIVDTPEARTERDQEAMQAVMALHPEDAFEARLAARIVAMDAHAADCLRLAGLTPDDRPEMRRCRAQAACMARQSDSALRDLKRMQATREKQLAEMHPAAMERAGYWWRDCSVPAPPTPPADEEPALTQARADADAALYETMYPDRAALIRAAGGVPPDVRFGPPEPYIVAALLRRAAHGETLSRGSGLRDGAATLDAG